MIVPCHTTLREVMPHGEGDGHWPMMPQKLQKAITFKPELSFGQGYSQWKSLNEHKAMVSLCRGIQGSCSKVENLYPIP
jgi:hypothetical protein